MNEVIVQTADFVIDYAPSKLVTHGIGSCVVVCLFCRRLKLGALGHFMLPKAPIGYSGGSKYVNSSLDSMVFEFLEKGVQKSELIVSLVGGAQMFKVLESSTMNIGQRNTDEAKLWFQENDLMISMLDVGGSVGRNVEFDLDTGIVKVSKNV